MKSLCCLITPLMMQSTVSVSLDKFCWTSCARWTISENKEKKFYCTIYHTLAWSKTYFLSFCLSFFLFVFLSFFLLSFFLFFLSFFPYLTIKKTIYRRSSIPTHFVFILLVISIYFTFAKSIILLNSLKWLINFFKRII
jgi:hypothetical protein